MKNNIQEVDENSHELFSIYKDYEQINETLIIQKVIQKHPSFDIETFFKELSNHPDIYQNDDTFDLLSEMIDFESFKANLIKHKSASNKAVATETTDATFDILLKLITDDPNLPENGWSIVSKQKEGMCVQAFKKKIPDFNTDLN